MANLEGGLTIFCSSNEREDMSKIIKNQQTYTAVLIKAEDRIHNRAPTLTVKELHEETNTEIPVPFEPQETGVTFFLPPMCKFTLDVDRPGCKSLVRWKHVLLIIKTNAHNILVANIRPVKVATVVTFAPIAKLGVAADIPKSYYSLKRGRDIVGNGYRARSTLLDRESTYMDLMLTLTNYDNLPRQKRVSEKHLFYAIFCPIFEKKYDLNSTKPENCYAFFVTIRV